MNITKCVCRKTECWFHYPFPVWCHAAELRHDTLDMNIQTIQEWIGVGTRFYINHPRGTNQPIKINRKKNL